MTIVGKILVFVNLVFSLVVGGLVMMVYLTRTNWEDGYTKLAAQHATVVADRKQLEAEKETLQKNFDAQLAAARKEKDDAIGQRDAAQAVIKRTTAELEAIKAGERRDLALGQAGTENIDARRAQAAQMELDNRELREKNLDLIKEKNEERKARIQADVLKKSFEARAKDMEEQLKEMSRAMIRNQGGTTGGFVVRKRGDENPPPDNVEGKIKEVDPEDGLVKLSIGSDHGLAPGHTLKAFRLDPIPDKSRYLGTIEILTVRPHEAVGRPTSRVPVSLRPGDRVASRLLVGGN